MADEPGLFERTRAYFRAHSLSQTREIDLYLSEHMYDLIDKYNLALKTDLIDIDKKMNNIDERISNLEKWREDTERRIESVENRVELLEKKYGIKK